MKKHSRIRSTLLISTFVLLTALVGAETSSAKTVKLTDVKIPRTYEGPAFSQSFIVSNRGTLRIKVGIMVDSLLGAGQSIYEAELMRTNDNLVLASQRYVVITNLSVKELIYTIPDCSKTGSYRIRVRNTSTENPQKGVATFPQFTVPSTDPATGPLSTFSVAQGLTVDRSIPTSPINLQPSGTGGNMLITATWNSICGADPAGCRLTFRLKRNGTTVASSTGYSHNALFGNASPRMTINYTVPANQVSGTWSLQVAGAASGSATNVKPTVKFTPVCQN